MDRRLACRSPRISRSGTPPQASRARLDPGLLAGPDGLLADGLLELEDEPGADRFDDGRRARLLAVLRVGQVDVLLGVHVGDRAATDHRRHPVVEQLAPRHQQPRCARTADELVRRDEHRVLVVESCFGGVAVGGRPPRSHVDVDIGCRRREVPERERAVTVKQHRDGARVGQDAGHVRGGREAAYLELPVGVADELVLQLPEVDAAVGILVDGDHVGDGLAPWQLVGVVLIGADEDDRSFRGRDMRAQIEAVVELGRQADAQHAHQLVHRGRRARAAEDDRVLLVGSDRLADDAPGVLAEARRLQAGPG